MQNIIILVAIGFIAGIVSASLGVGGGILVVPLLIFFLKTEMKQAIGTSLAVIVPIALVGAISHYKLGNIIDPKLALLIAVGGIVGALLGALLVKYTPAYVLRKAFAVMLLIVVVKLFME